MIKVVPIDWDSKEIETFIELPWQIYKNTEHISFWVPPMKTGEKVKLSPSNPFFAHGTAQAFLAYNEYDVAVGRILASIDDRLKNVPQQKTGHFGYFECINNEEVAKCLFSAAENWLRVQGATTVDGPLNFNIFSSSYRLQTDGFTTTPFVGEPRNPKYYVDLVTKNNFKVKTSWHSWDVSWRQLWKVYFGMFLNKLKKRTSHAKLKSADMKKLETELRELHPVVTKGFSENYGFSAISEDELVAALGSLEPLMFPGSITKAYDRDHKVVGFACAYVDMAYKLQEVNGEEKNLSVLNNLTKKDVKRLVWYAFGVDKEYRKTDLAYRLCLKYATLSLLFGRPVVGALTKEGKTLFDRLGKPSRSYSVFTKEL